MPDTDVLIDRLSRTAGPVRPLPSPRAILLRLLMVLAVNLLGAVALLGVRPDLGLQLTRPLFVLELAVLLLVSLTSVHALTLLLSPDQFQRGRLGRGKLYRFNLGSPQLPLLLFGGLGLFWLAQWGLERGGRALLGLPVDPRPVLEGPTNQATLECVLCIAAVAALPAGILLLTARAGATLRPRTAGALAVIAATSIGMLGVRLEEANDSMTHLLLWHYLPTLGFATLGAIAGKFLLKW